MEPYKISTETLKTLLQATGWIDQGSDPSEAALTSLVQQYQQFHGLTPDGYAGPVTERSLKEPRFCGCGDRLEMGGEICKWEKKQLAYSIRTAKIGINQDNLLLAFATAWSFWEEVCDIQAARADRGDIKIGFQQIDRDGGTLAWSHLPCGRDRQLQQRYDTSEPWVIAENPPRQKIDLVRVAAHEIGHALGIEHGPSGALMAPIYNASIRRPQVWDIQEARRRYGPPKKQSPQPAAAPVVTVEVGSEVWRSSGMQRI